MEKTDRNLIDAYLGDDRLAFTVIVNRHGPAVLGYLIKMCRNKQQAEDFFQETFQRVHRKAHTFRGETMKPWLFKIATNVALNGFKKAKRLPVVSLDSTGNCTNGNCSPIEYADAAAADPAETAQKTEQAQLVRRAIQDLPTRQRTTLILAYYDRLSYSQIAKVLDCSLGTVKSQMFRALKTLRRTLPDVVGGLL